MLPLGVVHVKHAMQRVIYVPTQHLLWDQEKPQKTLIELPVAGPSGRNTPALTLVLYVLFLFTFLKNIYNFLAFLAT
jgi:hypothetical protein